ncbi:LysR family transcriptional regulator [Dactylosporangium salmoneum]
MDLDLRLVRYFVAVAEELHFGRAAARLYIAQPSLSAQIRHLEELLGTQLLVRTTRRVELTPAGALFLAPARQLLAAASEALRAATAPAPVRVATIVDGLDTLPKILREMRRLHPQLDVAQGIAGMPRQLAEVEADRLDVALGRRTRLPVGLAGELVRFDPVRVVMRADSSLAARDPLPVAALGSARWVFGSTEHTPDWVDFVVGFLKEAGVDPGPVRCSQVPLSAILEQVSELDGVSAWPVSCPDPGFGLVVRRLVEPTPVFEWELVWRRDAASRPAVTAMRAAARAAADRCGWLDPGLAVTRAAA